VMGRVAGLIAGGAVLIITILIWMIVPRLVKPTGP
jgi:low affinity Fe/Cu permease